MKRKFTQILSLAIGVLISVSTVNAQTSTETKPEGYKFTVVKEVKATSVKDQYRAGTCWSYSGLSFLESEVLRMDKGETDLSEMYIVRRAYEEKGMKYFRMHGKINFGQGGAFHDVTNMIRSYGIVPEEIYRGLNYGEKNHVHGEVDVALKAFLDAIIKDENKTISTAWYTAYKAILDAYFGPVPEKFTYKGKDYTPQSYAKEIGLNSDDYVCVTSFMHHPFYKPFALEIEDNWMWEPSYNVPMEDLIAIIDNSIQNGYSIAWGSDVSEKGFSFKNGVAIVPAKDISALNNLEMARWDKLSQKDKDKELYTFDKPGKEKVITQEDRQKEFDNYKTTDDHGMHITGIAKDQNGNKFYIVKNSWAESNDYKGYFYASEAFVKAKTTDIMINKKAIPEVLRKKLGL
jgi:bleomycin hydrolase